MIEINYNARRLDWDTLEVEDIGNIVLEATNSNNDAVSYLWIRTRFGISYIFTFGPLFEEDEDTLKTTGITYNFRKAKFNRKAIKNTIFKFINSNVDMVEIISEEDLREKYKDPIEFIDYVNNLC